jgi:hypothetical protein
MKLLTRDKDKIYLHELKRLLEDNGIPAIVQGENTARILPSFLMSQAGLWVYLDQQFEDAVNLMMDTDHKVTTGIDVDEFYMAQPAEEEQTNLLNKALIDLALFAIYICIGMFVFIKILELIST